MCRVSGKCVGSAVLLAVIAASGVLAEETTLTFSPGDGGAYSDTEEGVLQAKYPSLTRETADVIEVGTYYSFIRVTVLRFPDIIGENEGQVPSGATIISATLKLKSIYAKNDTVSVYRIVESHDISASDALSWNNRAAGTAWTVPGAGYVSEAEKSRDATALDTNLIDASWTFYEWDVSAALEAWVANPSQNYGFVIENRALADGQSFGGSRNSYMDRRPILEVTYEVGPDTTPPDPVTDLSADGEIGQVTLSWTNPTDSDYAGALVVKKLGSAPTGTPEDGTAYSPGQALGDGEVLFVGNASDTGCVDTDITTDTYYYTVFARDASLNYSSGVTDSADPIGTAEVVFQTGDGDPYTATYDADLTAKYPNGVYDEYVYITTGVVYEGMRNGLIQVRGFIGPEEGQVPHNAQVVSAELELYGKYASGQDVSLYRVIEPFFAAHNSPSWNYRKPDIGWTVPGASYVSESEKSRQGTAEQTHLIDTDWEWYSFDVTATVQDYVNAPETNYGWILDNPHLTTNQVFVSSDEADWTWARPILRVEYTVVLDTTPPNLSISTPATSDFSPAFVEGPCSVDAETIHVSVNGSDPVDALRMSPTSWYVNVPLSSSSLTNVAVTTSDSNGNPANVEQDIEWEAVNIPDWSDFMIRKGDSVLLTDTRTGTSLEIDPGTGTWQAVGAPGDTLETTFDTSGVYTVRSRIDGGAEASVDVTVIDVDLRGYVTCQQRYRRDLEVYVTPAGAKEDVALVAEDPAKISVDFMQYSASGIVVYLAPGLEDAWFQARLAGASGPVISRQVVNVFNFESTAKYYVYVEPEGDDGSKVGTATVTMTPYYPNTKFRFLMSSPGVTFDGGVNEFEVFTETDFVQQPDGTATFDYNIHYAPGVTHQCHTIYTYQHSSPDNGNGQDGENNGFQCETVVTITPLPACVHKPVTFTVSTGGEIVPEPRWTIDEVGMKMGQSVTVHFTQPGEKNASVEGTCKHPDRTHPFSGSGIAKIAELIKVERVEPDPDCPEGEGYCIRPGGEGEEDKTVDIKFKATVEPNVQWAKDMINWSVEGESPTGETVEPATAKGQDEYVTAFTQPGEKTIIVKLDGCDVQKQVKIYVLKKFLIIPQDTSVCVGSQRVFKAMSCHEENGNWTCVRVPANWDLDCPTSKGTINGVQEVDGAEEVTYEAILVSDAIDDVTLHAEHPEHPGDPEWEDEVKITNTEVNKVQHDEQDVTDPVLAQVGAPEPFNAVIAPPEAAWPDGHPEWEVIGPPAGTVFPSQGEDHVRATFQQASQSLSQLATVKASCGTSEQSVQVFVCDLEILGDDGKDYLIRRGQDRWFEAKLRPDEAPPDWTITGDVTWTLDTVSASMVQIVEYGGEHKARIKLRPLDVEGGWCLLKATVGVNYRGQTRTLTREQWIGLVDLQSISAIESGNTSHKGSVSGPWGASEKVTVPLSTGVTKVDLNGVVLPENSSGFRQLCCFEVISDGSLVGSGTFDQAENLVIEEPNRLPKLYTFVAGPDSNENTVLDESERKYTLDIYMVLLEITALEWRQPPTPGVNSDDVCHVGGNLNGTFTAEGPAGPWPAVTVGMGTNPNNATVQPGEITVSQGTEEYSFSLTGTSPSPAYDGTDVQIRGGANVYAEEDFTVVKTLALTLTTDGPPSHSVVDSGQGAASPLYARQIGLNAQIGIGLTWTPVHDDLRKWFRWKINPATNWSTSDNDFRYFNPATPTWTNTETRAYIVSAGFDANEDDALGAGEVTREADVVVVKVRIENPTIPSWGVPLDADDILCVGDVDENHNPEVAAQIRYTILPAGLDLETKQLVITSDGAGVRTFAGAGVPEGENKAVAWDGKNASGEYAGHEVYTVDLSVKPTGVPQPFTSGYHIVDLGVRHKPKVYIHDGEFSPPVAADYHVEWSVLWDNTEEEYVAEWNGTYAQLLSTYNDPRYYLDLLDPSDDNWDTPDYRRNLAEHGGDGKVTSLGAVPTIYVRHDVHSSADGSQYAFVQYWMYQSASTLPIGETLPIYQHGGTPRTATVWHEGDWELFQVVLRLNVQDGSAEPHSASYSMHYYGLSLPWDDPTSKEVINIGDTPVIWIAGGSHATYPNGYPDDALWDTPEWYDNLLWATSDWYPQMYGAVSGTFDIAWNMPLPTYQLLPLDKYSRWQGHWGQVISSLVLPSWHEHTNDGPRSPFYREGAGTVPHVEPVEFHNSTLPDDDTSLGEIE